MTIDHEAFAEANQPPPERATETPEVEASPEVEPLLDGVTNVDGVAVACRLEEGTMHVTVLLPGRIESISTSVHVPFFDVAPAPESGGGSYSKPSA